MLRKLLSVKGLKEVACFVVAQEALDGWVGSGGLGGEDVKNDLGSSLPFPFT